MCGVAIQTSLTMIANYDRPPAYESREAMYIYRDAAGPGAGISINECQNQGK